ncbi:MAG: hypothetical protein JWN70_5495 [Planctomycetaceae bacterium]|nr:hypothetical protein [Planctomycetaceae bacterium]
MENDPQPQLETAEMIRQVAGIWSVKVKEGANVAEIIAFAQDEERNPDINPDAHKLPRESWAESRKRRAREAAQIADYQRREKETRDDTLELINGQIQLATLKSEGFSPGTYSVSKDEHAIELYAKQTHSNGDVATWSLRYTWGRYLSGGLEKTSLNGQQRSWLVDGQRNGQ